MNQREYVKELKKQAQNRFRDIKHIEKDISDELSERKERRTYVEKRRKENAKEFHAVGKSLDSAFGAKKKRKSTDIFTGRGIF